MSFAARSITTIAAKFPNELASHRPHGQDSGLRKRREESEVYV